MSSLPWEVVSRHVLGRLHARDARGVCQAFRSAFDAGVTTMTMEGSAHAGANDTSAERALQLILGSPGLRQLDIDDTCPFKADALRAAAARGPNLQHLRLYLPANRPIRATDALHAVATALAQHHGNLATLEIVAGRDSVSALAPALQALTSLRALILSDTSLRLNDVVPVLRALTGLERLDLADNSLLEDDADDGAAADLGAALRSLPALRALDLSSNGIGPAGVAALAPALASLSALRELSLGSNAIGCDGAVHLASALASKTALTTLDVSANDLGALGAAALAAALGSLAGLRSLDLSSNGIGAEPEGIAALVPAIGRCEALVELSLRDNDIGPQDFARLSEGLRRLTKLRKLDLTWNRCNLFYRGEGASEARPLGPE